MIHEKKNTCQSPENSFFLNGKNFIYKIIIKVFAVDILCMALWHFPPQNLQQGLCISWQETYLKEGENKINNTKKKKT